jgi:uncharacterized protein (TIGR02646 family)
MRWVDIYELEFPNRWCDLATKALNELKAEIVEAELSAKSSGDDIQIARKKAITNGLKKRSNIWREIAPSLEEIRKGKCWYSESKNSGSDKDVDHFRPKNAVKEDSSHEGYWWLAFDWKNYRYSCQWCNQRRVDVIHGTDGGKWDHFPLKSNSFRARQESDNYEDEEIDLLDPTVASDCKLLTFRPDGHPIPTKTAGTRDYERAEVSIRLYHLDHKDFVQDRRILAGKIQRIVQEMDVLRPKIIDLQMRKLYQNKEMELFRLIDRNSEYSSAALAYARFEVYSHQVKREWLQEILNSNP